MNSMAIHVSDPHEIQVLALMLRHKRFTMQMLLKHYPLTTSLTEAVLKDVDPKMHLAFFSNKHLKFTYETFKNFTSIFNLTKVPLRIYSNYFFRAFLESFFNEENYSNISEEKILRIDTFFLSNKITPWSEKLTRQALKNELFLSLLQEDRLRSTKLPLFMAKEYGLSNYIDRITTNPYYEEENLNKHDNSSHIIFSKFDFKSVDDYITQIEESINKWDILSKEIGMDFWSLRIIEKHEDKWNWELLASNTAIHWDDEAISKFKHRFNANPNSWLYLSLNPSVQWDESTIEEFIDDVYWGEFNESESEEYGYFGGLSDNIGIEWDIKLIKRFETKICWDSFSLNPKLNWDYKLLEAFEKNWNWIVLEKNDEVIWKNIFEKYLNEEKIKWFFGVYLKDEMSRIHFDDSEDKKANAIFNYYKNKSRNPSTQKIQ